MGSIAGIVRFRGAVTRRRRTTTSDKTRRRGRGPYFRAIRPTSARCALLPRNVPYFLAIWRWAIPNVSGSYVTDANPAASSFVASAEGDGNAITLRGR